MVAKWIREAQASYQAEREVEGLNKPDPNPANALLCERCEQPLDPAKADWLEMDSRSGTMYEPGKFPPELAAEGRSQGFFAYGKACANAIRRDGYQYGKRVAGPRSR